MKTKTLKRMLRIEIEYEFRLAAVENRKATPNIRWFSASWFFPHPWFTVEREQLSTSKRKDEDLFRANGDWSTIHLRLIEKRDFYQRCIDPKWAGREWGASKQWKLVSCLFYALKVGSWFNPHKRIIVVDSLFTDSNKSNHHFSLSFSPRCQQWHEQTRKKKTAHSRFIGYCAVHVLLLSLQIPVIVFKL